MLIDNASFLQALFKDDAPFAHITDFTFDPSDIPSDQHLRAWRGDWASRYAVSPGTNQYFTISIFNADERGVARRRKALFLRTRVIVLDDVREKLLIDQAQKLPQPAWILETSPGSEQWGYILTEPCHDRARVENLLDGLVANGLAPDGTDPGMKGVTRYVRLPEGYNTKASKRVGGLPFKCRMVEWHPERTVTLEELAAPFHVNLDAVRREARVDGAADIPDHPLLQIPDIIRVKEIRSNGRFDITCPWVDEHTGAADDGAAVFTNEDGSIGFKCHHGSCEHRTARDMVQYIESQSPGFGAIFSNWKTERMFADVSTPDTVAPSLPAGDSQIPDAIPSAGVDVLMDDLRREGHTTPEARLIAQKILYTVDTLSAIDRQQYHKEVCDLMHWSKTEFTPILKSLRGEWYKSGTVNVSFMTDIIFIKEQNRFYDFKSRIFYTPESFQNSFADVDAEARKTALQGGRVVKVDRIDFAPGMSRIFERDGIKYGNMWCASHTIKGVPGDCERWFDHWHVLGWSENQLHMMQWMRYTIEHPEAKINHMLLLGGREGCGKDFLLYPLIRAMGEYSTTISGEELTTGYNDYLLTTKHLHINETELGDHHMAKEVSAKLKPLAAAPPMTLRINQKFISHVKISNIVNATMSTNSTIPLRLTGVSRRIYAAWSNLNVRDENDEMLPEWKEYWTDRWNWMENGGYLHCIHYLLNEVDMTGFNPGLPPPMTDFLRDIYQHSKPPGQLTIEAFINKRLGAFKSDLITASDALVTLRAGEIKYADNMLIEGRWFNPVKVGRILGDIGVCQQLRANNNGKAVRIWVIRNIDRYRSMFPSDLYAEYERQMDLHSRVVPIGSHMPQKKVEQL